MNRRLVTIIVTTILGLGSTIGPATALAADTTPPTISITAPMDGQHFAFGATINAVWECSDTESVVATCDATTPIDGTAGTHMFTVQAVDGAGNTATKSITYTVDPETTPPTISIFSPVDGQHYALGVTIDSLFTCADPGGSGVATCVAATPIETTVGTHTFTVNATDNAGNPATKSVSYTVDPDTTAPTISITSPVNGQHYAFGTNPPVTFFCTDAGGSNIATCDATTPIVTSAGTHTFTVNATDNAGNPATRSVTYIVDPPPGGGGATPGGGGATPGGGNPADDVTGSTGLASTPRITLPTRASRAALARGVTLSLSRLKARSRVTLQIRRGSRTIKTLRATANAAGTVRFRIRLSAAQRRTLQGKTLTLRFSTTAANGTRKTVTKKLKVV